MPRTLFRQILRSHRYLFKYSLARPPPRASTLHTRSCSRLHKQHEDDIDLTLEDHGNYDIILPQDPLASSSRGSTRSVPSSIPRPPYAPTSHLKQRFRQIRQSILPDLSPIPLGGEEEQKLRRAAQLAERTLVYAGTLVQEGITTDAIDAKVHEFIIANNAYPSPLLYKGFPKSCCTSVNNIMVHGIPDYRPLHNGDIVNIDITVYLDGYHGDTSRTFLVGQVDNLGKELVQITEQALEAGIAACAPLRPFRDIGKAIHSVVRGKNFSVSSAFTGHGIGSVFHCLPWIIHVPNTEPGTMQPGHCFTIEPCVVRGTNADHMVFGDGWTTSSTNWSRSAQAEHMVLITDNGAESHTILRLIEAPMLEPLINNIILGTSTHPRWSSSSSCAVFGYDGHKPP